MVLIVVLVVSGATWVLSITTSVAMGSTSIVVPIPSSVPPILTIPNLVLKYVLAREGGTKGGRTKFGKTWA